MVASLTSAPASSTPVDAEPREPLPAPVEAIPHVLLEPHAERLVGGPADVDDVAAVVEEEHQVTGLSFRTQG